MLKEHERRDHSSLVASAAFRTIRDSVVERRSPSYPPSRECRARENKTGHHVPGHGNGPDGDLRFAAYQRGGSGPLGLAVSAPRNKRRAWRIFLAGHSLESSKKRRETSRHGI